MGTHPTTARAPRILWAYAVGVPLIIVPLPIEQSIGAVDILFPFALWALLRNFHGRLSPAEVTFWLFMFTAFSATIWLILNGDQPPGVGEVESLLIIRLLAIFTPLLLVLQHRTFQPNETRSITIAFLISASTASAIGIVLHALGIRVRDSQQTIWIGGGVESTLRAGGLLGNSGDFGHLTAILGVVSITFGLVYLGKPGLSILLFGVAAYGTYISSSRAALLHLLIALLLMVPVLARGRRVLAAAIAVVAAAPIALILGSFITLAPAAELTLRRLDILNLTGESLFFSSDSRLSTWNLILQLIQDHPMSGIGYASMVAVTGGAGDNSFLTLTVELGIIAGALYLLFWLSLGWRAFKSGRGPKRVVAVAVTFSEIAHMATIDTHSMWATAPVGLMMVGLAIASAESDSAARGVGDAATLKAPTGRHAKL